VLNWLESSVVTGFTVQRATNSTFTAGLVAFPIGAVLTYTDTTGSHATTYFYRVIAVNAAGNSGPSNVVSAVTFK
jgi:titin